MKNRILLGTGVILCNCIGVIASLAILWLVLPVYLPLLVLFAVVLISFGAASMLTERLRGTPTIVLPPLRLENPLTVVELRKAA